MTAKRDWLCEIQLLQQQVSATLPELKGPPQLFLRIFADNIDNPAYRDRFLLFLKQLALCNWATRFTAGEIGEEPTRYAGGAVVDFSSDINAPLFFESVVEPRLRKNLSELKWLIDLPKRYPHVKEHIAFGILFRCYLDLLLSLEVMAGKLTYHNYGSLPNFEDPKYWKVQQESFHAVGLHLCGAEMFSHAFKGNTFGFFDEMIRLKHKSRG
ncbi:hypothetical protein [Synechococcus sp. MW101C3]|uniref:hypothetical protein n=1 Tax=Synechococcus sp. MW101C3 TaxID=210768 RepID=UPI001181BA5A|nr:hypothetical protein [Synechococcus sp. MW101C3]